MGLDSNKYVAMEAVKLSLVVSIFLNIHVIRWEMKKKEKVPESDRCYQEKERGREEGRDGGRESTKEV